MLEHLQDTLRAHIRPRELKLASMEDLGATGRRGLRELEEQEEKEEVEVMGCSPKGSPESTKPMKRKELAREEEEDASVGASALGRRQ